MSEHTQVLGKSKVLSPLTTLCSVPRFCSLSLFSLIFFNVNSSVVKYLEQQGLAKLCHFFIALDTCKYKILYFICTFFYRIEKKCTSTV